MRIEIGCRSTEPSTFRGRFLVGGVYIVVECWQPTRAKARRCLWRDFRKAFPAPKLKAKLEVEALTRRPKAGHTPDEERAVE